ncbi:MAG TPA: SPOR domain-containing protein, partial [Gallionellaceae bacterium]|nr:SPOR domain-containing protein [Gallionellaceae bacterium]
MDVSYAAAYKLDIIGSGSAEVEVESIMPGQSAPIVQTVMAEPVQVEPLSPESAPVAATAPVTVVPQVEIPVAVVTRPDSDEGGKVFLQLGSFRSPEGAESFLVRMRDELGDLGKQVVIYTQGGLTRVHLGPYHTTEEARASADKLESRLGFKPFISLH